MKTLAGFKRMIKPGQHWHAFNHPMNRDMGTREVSTFQSNAFAFKTERGESWCQFPKAKDFKVLNESTVQIFQSGVLVLTYEKKGDNDAFMEEEELK